MSTWCRSSRVRCALRVERARVCVKHIVLTATPVAEYEDHKLVSVTKEGLNLPKSEEESTCLS